MVNASTGSCIQVSSASIKTPILFLAAASQIFISLLRTFSNSNFSVSFKTFIAILASVPLLLSAAASNFSNKANLANPVSLTLIKGIFFCVAAYSITFINSPVASSKFSSPSYLQHHNLKLPAHCNLQAYQLLV